MKTKMKTKKINTRRHAGAWSNGAASKADGCKSHVGSNPTASAKINLKEIVQYE